MDEQVLYRAIGLAVRRARTEAGLRQEDLAEQVGLTRTSIANLESGRQRMPIHMIYRMAEVMGITPHDLLPADAVGLLKVIKVLDRTVVLSPDEIEELRKQLDGNTAQGEPE